MHPPLHTPATAWHAPVTDALGLSARAHPSHRAAKRGEYQVPAFDYTGMQAVKNTMDIKHYTTVRRISITYPASKDTSSD